jgi:hypothetical protein
MSLLIRSVTAMVLACSRLVVPHSRRGRFSSQASFISPSDTSVPSRISTPFFLSTWLNIASVPK